jgi:hypothetical protein
MPRAPAAIAKGNLWRLVRLDVRPHLSAEAGRERLHLGDVAVHQRLVDQHRRRVEDDVRREDREGRCGLGNSHGDVLRSTGIIARAAMA